jgi:hypothetical protein
MEVAHQEHRAIRLAQRAAGRSARALTDNAAGRPDEARVAALSVSTGEIKTLINGGTNPRYSPTGHLLFARGGTLYAVPFDAQPAEVTGAERALLAGLMTEQNGAAHFAVATGGTLAYVAGDTASIERELVWVDRQGTVLRFTQFPEDASLLKTAIC